MRPRMEAFRKEGNGGAGGGQGGQMFSRRDGFLRRVL